MFKRMFICILLVGVLMFSLSAVKLTGVEELATDQILRVGTAESDVGTLDPHKATGGQDRNIADMIFNGLVRYKPGSTTEFEPDLANDLPEPKMVEDKQVWTFHLREGVMTHPFPGYPEGYELTAEDIVYSFEKAANPEQSAFAGAYDGISAEAVDKYTVNIIVKTPLSPILFFPKVADVAGGFIVPKKAVEQLGIEDFSTHPIGTGPFKFKDYDPGDKIVLTRNNNYFRGKPHLEKIEYFYMPEEGSRELALKAGELDIGKLAFTQDAVERVEGYGVPVKIFGPGSSIVLFMNMDKEPLDSIKVRKAIAYALNRVDNLGFYGKVAMPLYSQVPPPEVMIGGLSKKDLIDAGLDYMVEVDLEKARKLLKEAGYPDGFTLEVSTTPHPNYKPGFEIAQAQLKKIGIEVKISIVDHGTYHSRIREDLNPLVAYSAPRENADTYLTQFWHSNSIVVKGKSPVTNFSHYTKVDDLIEQARTETDPEKQEELWEQAQIKILRDAACYPTVYLQRVWAIQDYVDLGYELVGSWAQYPPINENTKLLKH